MKPRRVIVIIDMTSESTCKKIQESASRGWMPTTKVHQAQVYAIKIEKPRAKK